MLNYSAIRRKRGEYAARSWQVSCGYRNRIIGRQTFPVTVNRQLLPPFRRGGRGVKYTVWRLIHPTTPLCKGGVNGYLFRLPSRQLGWVAGQKLPFRLEIETVDQKRATGVTVCLPTFETKCLPTVPPLAASGSKGKPIGKQSAGQISSRTSSRVRSCSASVPQAVSRYRVRRQPQILLLARTILN